MFHNIHESYHNVDNLTDAEFAAVEIKFFEIFGLDKDSSAIEIVGKELLNRSICINCLFQNNYFLVQIQQQ